MSSLVMITESTETVPSHAAAGVAVFLGVAELFFGVAFLAGFAFPAEELFFAGLLADAGPLVTRPDFVFPRIFGSSTMAGACSRWVSEC